MVYHKTVSETYKAFFVTHDEILPTFQQWFLKNLHINANEICLHLDAAEDYRHINIHDRVFFFYFRNFWWQIWRIKV